MAQQIIILLFLAMAAGFARYLVKRDQGEREPVRALWVAFSFGLVGIVVAAALESYLLPTEAIEAGSLGLGALGWAVLAIGLIEELCKSVFLIWYIYGKRYFNEHTDGVIYFALAGLGFGLPENILYTYQFGAGTGMLRVVMTPLFHAATTALVGYALVKVKLGKASKRSVLLMLGWVIGLHALYDFGLLSGDPLFALVSIMITLGLAVGIFLLFLHARSLDQLQGLSVVGHNNFCRSCGTPNPNHKLYCSHCGKRA